MDEQTLTKRRHSTREGKAQLLATLRKMKADLRERGERLDLTTVARAIGRSKNWTSTMLSELEKEELESLTVHSTVELATRAINTLEHAIVLLRDDLPKIADIKSFTNMLNQKRRHIALIAQLSTAIIQGMDILREKGRAREDEKDKVSLTAKAEVEAEAELALEAQDESNAGQ